MSWTLKIVLVLVACLVTCASAGDDEEATNGLTRTVITVPVVNQTLGTEEKLVTIGQAGEKTPKLAWISFVDTRSWSDGLGVFFVQMITMTLISLSAIYIIHVLFLPNVEHRSLSWDLWGLLSSGWSGDDLGVLDRVINSTRLYPEKELEHLEYYDDHKYYGSQRHPRSVVDDVSFLTQVFKSIDTVESALDTMKVDHLACRELAVCHLQRIASKLPSLGLLLQVISPSISGMEKYREAQEAGAALEDCTLLYSECPTSLARFLKGDHTG
ncbi:putative DM4/DM12 family-like protein 24 [Homarus americanus]|uniref:Putative DM4/DM12 family-like protein 24 n=1 Tax=Homarus americanus TaxID=6706 RepID=A0A8J5JKU3_HOMAM|nr:putative DM4/DM12 family-like protein 24 [Homarus americanus]